MYLTPLENVAKGAPRKSPVHGTALNLNRHLKFAVGGVKMSWFVISIEHGNDDTQKSRYLGHGVIIAREKGDRLLFQRVYCPRNRRKGIRARHEKGKVACSLSLSVDSNGVFRVD